MLQPAASHSAPNALPSSGSDLTEVFVSSPLSLKSCDPKMMTDDRVTLAVLGDFISQTNTHIPFHNIIDDNNNNNKGHGN